MKVRELDFSEVITHLGRAAIFANLPEEDLRGLASLVESRECSPKEVIIEQGDFGDALYYICRGVVEVYVHNQEGAKNVIGRLNEGDFFGEMAILTGAPRSASVKVLEDTLLLVLEKKEFDAFIGSHPQLAMVFSRLLAERLSATTRLFMSEVDKEAQLKKLLSQEEEQHLTQMVGKTKKFQAVEKKIQEMSESDEPLMITGPDGSAAEDVARLIHFNSTRRGNAFFIIDLGGGDDWRIYRERVLSTLERAHGYDKYGLFEEFQISTIFGHEPDSLTGARARRLGHLELADSGTLVLKNIDKLSIGARESLLFYLLEKNFYRFGGMEKIRVDTRIIATMSIDVKDGGQSVQRSRLFTMLKKNSLDLPPLAQRRPDIPMIAEHYLAKHTSIYNKDIRGISAQAMNVLVRYHWPGNEHELESVIERGVMLCEGDILQSEHIFLGLQPYSEKGRVNLLRKKNIRKAFSHLLGRDLIQYVMIFVMTASVLLALWGIQDPVRNVGNMLVWYYWWPFLLISFLLLGRFYCSICPIFGLTKITRKLGSMNLAVPQMFQRIGISIAAILGIGLFWFEEIYRVKWSPSRTAFLLGIIVLGAVVVNAIFKQELWCRYICPMGYFSGISACLSITELRANNSVCTSQCKLASCYRGDDEQGGCPMELFPVSLKSNQFCNMCGTCVSNCQYNAIHLDLRWPGAEIWENHSPDLITALSLPPLLAILIPLFIMESDTGHVKDWLSFSLIFFVSALGSLVIFFLASIDWKSTFSWKTLKREAGRYGFAYLPLAFAGHLAFQLPYMLTGLSRLTGSTAGELTLISPLWLQRSIITAGTLFSLYVIRKISKESEAPVGLAQSVLIAFFGLALFLVVGV